MVQGNTMDRFLDHLISRRDSLLAMAAWKAFTNEKHDADVAMDQARKLNSTIEILTEYIKGTVLPGSVKILTSP